MKGTLKFFSTLSLIVGIILGLVFVTQAVFTEGTPNFAGLIAGVSYFVTGLISWATLGGLAEVLDRLEALEAKR